MKFNRNNKLNFRSVFSLKKWAFFIILILSLSIKVKANNEPELIKGFATAYPSDKDTTYKGDKVHEGICGGCKEYYGKTIVLYQRLPGDEVGEIIGIYECLDWGPGTQGFQEGRVIDVYRSSKDRCKEFMKRVYEDDCQGKVFIQVIDAKG